MYFENVGAFHEGKSDPQYLKSSFHQKKLFSSLWYVEVDENVIIIPNRAEPPIFILGKEMLKVFGFVSRNNNLTHDEYRAGHQVIITRTVVDSIILEATY